MASLWLDAIPAAVQSPGQTPSAEMVHAHVGSREEEDHQGDDHHGVGAAATYLQLPPMERSEDYLQEVGAASVLHRRHTNMLQPKDVLKFAA